MTLVPHQGDAYLGVGTLDLTCGHGSRYIQVRFQAVNGKPVMALPGSPDGKYGRGTSLIRLGTPDESFVFVTAFSGTLGVVGESMYVLRGADQECVSFSAYVLNCLVPGFDLEWTLGDWRIASTRTPCAYDLTRVSLPAHEINLTHTLTVTRHDEKPFRWHELQPALESLLSFLSFANCARISAPVIHGHSRDGGIEFFRFEGPSRSLPTNRRSWATDVNQNALGDGLSLFVQATESPFWVNIFNRVIDWQILAEMSTYDSDTQPLFTVQMLLEMLSFVVLVEDANLLGEDGYAKLPASDRITLLCGHTGQKIAIEVKELEAVNRFCRDNSIKNIGELITALRNKLIHPTKRNREYLEQVPRPVHMTAIVAGLQIASLVILKVMGYNGAYYDTISSEERTVPWAAPR